MGFEEFVEDVKRRIREHFPMLKVKEKLQAVGNGTRGYFGLIIVDKTGKHLGFDIATIYEEFASKGEKEREEITKNILDYVAEQFFGQMAFAQSGKCDTI